MSTVLRQPDDGRQETLCRSGYEGHFLVPRDLGGESHGGDGSVSARLRSGPIGLIGPCVSRLVMALYGAAATWGRVLASLRAMLI